ncbi:16S rRNA (adenine(1518)-N(6)/adenine(1519)-N(6))-dimethyltransferase RsmA [Halarsenatibacter silvermanii]|uniref:Ribosomal RNA small subunit methyltransferase A n=1 Tax=Halarsenatibacter silvermanii TaxID=321763 RepID=A0A1G9GYR8_9FIRM|nr:16S rRNA (adenine(1518)-N(6)/adenine(1519)-N(6))-dimethyltransferase RsmA [Halarsenatibacter silvermanii]SDL05734.1 dimethyladenosine transferase [Halarsenatibacter silvermanii]
MKDDDDPCSGLYERVAPERTLELIRKYDLEINKSLGQNFLRDRSVLEKAVEAADLSEKDRVIEIGPGLGALTGFILKHLAGGEVLAVEKDEKLSGILDELLGEDPALEIMTADALELDWSEVISKRDFDRGYKLMANLPYYITSPLIRTFLEADMAPDLMVLMVQKEVAERITAEPGGGDYGILSIAVQFYCRPEIIEIVPPDFFMPEPDVCSALIRLNMSSEPRYRVSDREFFFRTVRAMFGQRRKMLRNSLSGSPELPADKEQAKKALTAAGIDERLRGEKLSIEEVIKLSEELKSILN